MKHRHLFKVVFCLALSMGQSVRGGLIHRLASVPSETHRLLFLFLSTSKNMFL